MKKKIALALNLLLLALVLVWFITVRRAGEGMFPQVSAQTLDKIHNKFLLTDKDILEVLRYNDRELPFDAEKEVFYLPLSMYAEDWEQGVLSSGTEGVEITFLSDIESMNKLELIKSGQELPFYAYTEGAYKEYGLILTGLSVMEITTIEPMPVSENEEEDGLDGLYHMRLLNADSKENWVTESDMLMHVRGNTSQTYPKKGYKLQLVEENAKGAYEGNKQTLLGYRTDDDWVLYAMYNDGTKMRDKLSIDIWNAFGARNNDFEGKLGTDMTYIEVIWDGEYYGMYGLMEPVDSKQVNLSKEDGLHLTEYLYKRKHPSSLNTAVFMEESGAMEREGFAIKGGRATAVAKDWMPLKDFLDWQQQESDVLFAAQADQFIDMDNTVDMWIFTNIITGYDQLAKNVYYVAKNDGGQYRFYFAPWDMDLTWGYSSDPTYPLSTKYEGFLTENYIWWQPGDRMIETNAGGMVELAQERWKYLREAVITDEWLEEEMNRLMWIVEDSGAMARDEERWPEGNHDREYAELKNYAVKRMAWLDTFMSDIEKGMEDW